MSRTELTIQHRHLTRQIAQHVVRGVPAECLADLYLRLAAIEARLQGSAMAALAASTQPGEA